MKRTAVIAGLARFVLGFALATAGSPPRVGAQPRLERTGGAAVHAGAAEHGNDTGGGAAVL